MCPPLKVVLTEGNPHEVAPIYMALSGAALNFDLTVLSVGNKILDFSSTEGA